MLASQVEERRGLAKFIIAIAKDDPAEVTRNPNPKTPKPQNPKTPWNCMSIVNLWKHQVS
jgi:hypothetical protein